ncbi:MAG: zf-HC2 domain-containing protein [Turicibacter sp.]|nr:zf-HC2 domain-containing protein [Turicibacter sp.]
MTKKIDCEIVQDLLPIYIEGLTHEVTTKVVSEHLGDCGDCKDVYQLMKEPEERVEVEEVKQLNKFLKRIKTKGLITGALIIIAFWIGWVSYQKLFIDSITLAANQIVVEDLAMRTDGQLQFTLKDKEGHPLTWIYGEGYSGDGVYSFQAGRPLLKGPLSIDYGIGEKQSVDIEGFNKVIYKDEQGHVLVIWEEGMDLPVIEAPQSQSTEEVFVPGSYDQRDPGNLFDGQ